MHVCPCTLPLRAPSALWSTPAVYSASQKQSLAPISCSAQHATRAETPPTRSAAAFEACHILPSRLIFPPPLPAVCLPSSRAGLPRSPFFLPSLSLLCPPRSCYLFHLDSGGGARGGAALLRPH